MHYWTPMIVALCKIVS